MRLCLDVSVLRVFPTLGVGRCTGGTRAESVMAGYACTTGALPFVGFVLLSIPICYIYLLGDSTATSY